jgi:peptide/nickel transport system permease protein
MSKQQLMRLYGFGGSCVEQFALALRALHGDLGTSWRPAAGGNRGCGAVGLLHAGDVATVIGFVLGSLFGFIAGTYRDTWITGCLGDLGDRRLGTTTGSA